MIPWKMIFAHRYAEAASAYEIELKDNPTDPDLLGSHATALLCMYRFSESLRDFQHANQFSAKKLHGQTQPYLGEIGTLLWLLGRRSEAISTFRHWVDGIIDGSIKYGDNAGGVSPGLLLWYAALTAGDLENKEHAEKYLRKLAKKSRIEYWPGPISVFILNQKSEEETLTSACGTPHLQEALLQAKGDLLKRRQLVQALFYFAIVNRANGDVSKYSAQIRECANLENPILEMEWYLARFEVDSLSSVKTIT